MKKLLLIVCILPTIALAADDKIYRCGEEYTNTVTPEQAVNCKQISPPPLTKAEEARWQKCRLEAAKAPTEMGVRVALRVCYDQSLKK
jgi:hypothetical protein